MQDNPNYSYISTIKTPDNTTHYIKDAEAREAITQIGSPMHFKGSKANEAAIKAITSAKQGDMWLASDTHTEWVSLADISTATASNWEKIGSTEGLGALAFKSSASGSYTPSGTVSAPTITVSATPATVNSITAVGTLPTHASDTFTQGSYTQGTFTQGSLPSWSASVASETLSFSWGAGTLPTHGSDSFTKPTFTQGAFTQGTLPTKGADTSVVASVSATSSQPSFSGSPATITVS